MIKYAIKKFNEEILWKNRKEQLHEYCAVNQNWTIQKTIAIFDSLQDVEEELKKYETSVEYYEGSPYSFYHVTEYAIEIRQYDEDYEDDDDFVDIVGYEDITVFPSFDDIKCYD